MPTLLLELFSEEIPARMQQAAVRQLAEKMQAALAEQRIWQKTSDVQAFVTPRRLAVRIADIPAVQPDMTVEKKGPRISAPKKALEGFLRSTGLSKDQLEVRGEGKDATYFAVTEQRGQATSEIIKPLIEAVLSGFHWPKSMRWGTGETAWVRPLHSILCILDKEPVPVTFAGIAAGNITSGHRFLSPEAIIIDSPEQYEYVLENAYVLADAGARKSFIRAGLEKLSTDAGYVPIKDEKLLEEVTGLVEWPVVLKGNIDASFMGLPKEVIITVMREHQKYFALHTHDAQLAPHFLFVSNMQTADAGKAIIAGNERVARARFADGQFYWDLDRNTPLSDFSARLQGVTFHAKLGSVAEKVARMEALALALVPDIPKAGAAQVARAIQLCKADLTSGMVGEFPELQGVMGRYYALEQGESPEVANAIRDHYLPKGADDAVPDAPVSIAVALADKLDTLISFFAMNEKPTGSKDPFALRRAAIGVIRIILENRLRVPLGTIIVPPPDLSSEGGGGSSLFPFLTDRLKVLLKDQGLRHDVIAAVFAYPGKFDITQLVARAWALQDFLSTADGENLLAAYKRAANMVRIEAKKDGKPYDEMANESLLQKPEEHALFQALSASTQAVEQSVERDDNEAAMQALANLRVPVDAFFEQVLVNDENPDIRTNRLHLLSQLRDTMDRLADFSQIEG